MSSFSYLILRSKLLFKLPILKPFTKTMPRFPGPEEPVLIKVSVGSLARFKTNRVSVGVFLLVGTELVQFVRLIMRHNIWYY